MFGTQRRLVVAASVVALLTAGCEGGRRASSGATGPARHVDSPIVGDWQIDGKLRESDTNLPSFARLRFEADGTLDAAYVVTGGALPTFFGTPAKLVRERDTYELGDGERLRVIEPARTLEYTYEIVRSKLRLTAGPGAPAVYHLASDGEGERSMR